MCMHLCGPSELPTQLGELLAVTGGRQGLDQILRLPYQNYVFEVAGNMHTWPTSMHVWAMVEAQNNMAT